MRRFLPCVVLALLFALVGPRIVGPRNQAAGAPFVYEPPEGFVANADKSLADGENAASGVKAWVFEEKKNFDGSLADIAGRFGGVTRVVLTHSNKEISVEEADLAKLAKEMPKAFEDTGCSWVHRRHELRTRADGGRVGLIEGDCDRELPSPPGLPPQTIKSRKLQLIFPDDTGTSIVTVSYPTDKAARWEPLFEATIGKARGVATRAPVTPPWNYAAWGLAGAILGWLGVSLVKRKSSDEPPPPPIAAKAKANTRKKEEEEADEDDDNDEEDAS